MRLDYTSDLWWKNAIVYCLDVETYADSDGDGVGDFRGLIDKVDYLAGLGVTCLWLMPFFPSPNRDDGYDISDFYGVDPRLGTLGDFVEFVRTAGDRGIRVILDLVVNHTSDEHPWFAESRSSKDSPRRDWYVWRPEPSASPASLAFPDKETSNWQYDRRTGEYYLHRFYRFQPDLNIANPAVRDEICKIAAFWLALGVSGFRMDAVPFLLNQSLWLSLARGEAEPLEQVITSLPVVPHDNAWATFLRNHDELTLDKLTVSQREEVFAAFGPKPGMQMYGHGLRRRTAPMLGGDGPRLRMAWSLMFSLPGTPVVFMGDENIRLQAIRSRGPSPPSIVATRRRRPCP